MVYNRLICRNANAQEPPATSCMHYWIGFLDSQKYSLGPPRSSKKKKKKEKKKKRKEKKKKERKNKCEAFFIRFTVGTIIARYYHFVAIRPSWEWKPMPEATQDHR